VWMIIPGIGLLYGGLSRRKSSLSLLFQSIMVIAVVTFQWMFWGYSLAYARDASPFIGTLNNFGLMRVQAAPSPGSDTIPEIAFCFYQLLFAAVTVQIVIGGAFERGRIVPSLIFAFLWTTLVYCPVACWTWYVSCLFRESRMPTDSAFRNGNGWLANLPSLDVSTRLDDQQHQARLTLRNSTPEVDLSTSHPESRLLHTRSFWERGSTRVRRLTANLTIRLWYSLARFSFGSDGLVGSLSDKYNQRLANTIQASMVAQPSMGRSAAWSLPSTPTRQRPLAPSDGSWSI